MGSSHGTSPHAKPRWALVPIVLALGLGSHTISHALAPVEPLLHGVHENSNPEAHAMLLSDVLKCCTLQTLVYRRWRTPRSHSSPRLAHV